MFWGLIMEPQRRYTQKVKKAFHISMASLDVSTSSEEPAQVMVGFEGRNYLLCTLRKPDLLQCALDLNFEVGDELSLAANGKCHVHLTGYLIEDPNEFLEEEEEDEDEEEAVENEVKKKSKKRNKEELTNGPPHKKVKANNKNAQDEDSGKDDSDEDDSDVDVKALLLEKTLESDEDDENFVSDTEDNVEEEEDGGEEEESEADEEEEEDEEDDDDDDESSLSEADSDEDVLTPNKAAKLNGTPKKQEIVSPNKQKEKKDKKNEQKKQQVKETKTPNKENKSPKAKEAKKVLQNGLIIEDIKEGQGPPAKPGKYISVYYEGRLKSNNKVFDSTNKGNGFSFRLGGGEVIKGWDAGLVGMKLGGKRRLTCPPNMAYGPKGSPPAIPANSTLVFEVELKKIR